MFVTESKLAIFWQVVVITIINQKSHHAFCFCHNILFILMVSIEENHHLPKIDSKERMLCQDELDYVVWVAFRYLLLPPCIACPRKITIDCSDGQLMKHFLQYHLKTIFWFLLLDIICRPNVCYSIYYTSRGIPINRIFCFWRLTRHSSVANLKVQW